MNTQHMSYLQQVPRRTYEMTTELALTRKEKNFELSSIAIDLWCVEAVFDGDGVKEMIFLFRLFFA